MKYRPRKFPDWTLRYVVLIAHVFGILFAGSAFAANITVNVFHRDVAGTLQPITTGFRYTVEEDNSHPVIPGDRPLPADAVTPSNSVRTNKSLSFDFHASHAPIAITTTGAAAVGNSDTDSALVTDLEGSVADGRRYFISVLPYEGYAMGGTTVTVPDDASVDIIVQPHDIPTAQIAVQIFEDNQPLNGQWDRAALGGGVELGVGGPDWTILVEEPAGKFGLPGGFLRTDAFGNPLGTEYGTGAGCPTIDPGVPACITTQGDGNIHPGADGVALIKNLPPAKYGIIIVPPQGEGWQQTTTIEGTKVIDAWVTADEPAFFQEFGVPGPHVVMGFTQAIDNTGFLSGGATLSGLITNLHNSRPPAFTFYSGEPVPNCWVGLNTLGAGGLGTTVYAQPCAEDSSFSISNVPAGNYQMVIFDQFLDYVIGNLGVTVKPDFSCSTPDGECDFGDVPIFKWFGSLDGQVFIDDNENGIRDAGEGPMPADSADITIRFRDGTIYQNFPVDTEGFAPFDEVFPFFSWLVLETGFATQKATGATMTVDDGGPLFPGEALNPQEQFDEFGAHLQACEAGAPFLLEECSADNFSRTGRGPVLTMGQQVFLGQTNRIEFGKAAYGTGENGGISGVVFYAITRAEDDPANAAGEEWEPGIPRLQVNLYNDTLDNVTGLPVFGGDGQPDPIDPGSVTFDGITPYSYIPADVDNYPLDSIDNPFPGPEDVDDLINGTVGVFDNHDAVDVTWTDSFDDSKPSNCQGDVFIAYPGTANEIETDCYDGLRNYNQLRDTVFDGGYAFGGTDPHLPPGNYVVEAATPPGYKHIAEEDRNVDFGDSRVPSTLLLPSGCVGDDHVVPPFMTQLTKDGSGTLAQLINPADAGNPDAASPFAGETKARCDRKSVSLASGQNSAADFFLMTQTNKAARAVGFILDDFSNEFDPNSPNFGEKYAPPWLPVQFYDFRGERVTRVYGDEFGRYNALLPSTYSVDIPSASGVSPNMLTACMNDASPIDDGTGNLIPDPFHSNLYSQFCYTFQYMPGSTTYLDTPVVPIAAFAGPGQFPLDCEFGAGEPLIKQVSSETAEGGPFVDLTGGDAKIRILSAGIPAVPNPEYDGVTASLKTVNRNYGFDATAGSVNVLDKNGVLHPLVVNLTDGDFWNTNEIRVTVPVGTPSGTVLVTKNNGTVTPYGVTLTTTTDYNAVSRPVLHVKQDGTGDYSSIQEAIDNALKSQLILVSPGIYDELVVMYKPIKLQGWGALVTTINATKFPSNKLVAWRNKVDTLYSGAQSPVAYAAANGIDGQEFDLVPGQEVGVGPGGEPDLFVTAEGPGILVVGEVDGGGNDYTNGNKPRIDGLTVTGANAGGGILVNGYADFLEISNNRVRTNHGNEGGGIRVGHAFLTTEVPTGAAQSVLVHSDARNLRVNIHHNHVSMNGGQLGAGGGVSMYTGSTSYRVEDNNICGNFASTHGGGIAHFGFSARQLVNRTSTIARNKIVFNESFVQSRTVSGGGIFVGGKGPTTLRVPRCAVTEVQCTLPSGPECTGGATDICAIPNLAEEHLSPGSGHVKIVDNYIQGNLAGAGDGGGIRLSSVNGQDVFNSPTDSFSWYRVDLYNNMVTNNTTGLAGGGISLQDAIRTRIVGNTIANNDSTATAGEAFTPGSPNSSSEQPAGFVSRANSADLNNLIPATAPAIFKQGFSSPAPFKNNIIHHNRTFRFEVSTLDPTVFGLVPNIGGGDAPVYDDLDVLGAVNTLNPRFTMFSETYTGVNAGVGTNQLVASAGFINPMVNADLGTGINQVEVKTSVQAQPAFDEGGNFIDIRFGLEYAPGLGLLSCNATPGGALAAPEYHLAAGAAAIDAGQNLFNAGVEAKFDIDGDPRLINGDGVPPTRYDQGADEYIP